MASQSYDAALAFVLQFEGGYVNDPHDPGGPTNKGVTQRVYDGYRKRTGHPPRSVQKIDEAELQAIYRRQYWDAVRGDDLPRGVDLVVFDCAVNSGPVRAAKLLQAALGVPADGTIGEATLAAARSTLAADVIRKVCASRQAFLETLATFGRFGKGWTRRVEAARRTALDMVRGAPLPAEKADAAPLPRASSSDQKLTATTTGQGAVASAVGVAGSALTQAAQQVQPLGDFGMVFRILFAGLLVAGVALTVYGALKTAKSPEVLS